MAELLIEAKHENLEKVIEFVENELQDTACNMSTLMKIELSIEELYINIANYAYNPSDGDAKIEINILNNPDRVEIKLYDSGTPYNPLDRDDPDINIPAEDKPIGGLGVFLVKKNMDEYSYEYRDNMNIMTLVKNF